MTDVSSLLTQASGDSRTPESLLHRLRDPFDTDAWAKFVSLYTPLIYSCSCRAGLKSQDAHDAVQDVFVTLLRVLPKFSYDADLSFRRWLRTVTINIVRSKQKKMQTQTSQNPADLTSVAIAGNLEEVWEAEYRQHLIARALRLMKSDFQETTWRACWETVVAGRPAADVSAELGISVGAVYAAKFRVLALLRRELQGMID